MNYSITVYDVQYMALAKYPAVFCITEDEELQQKCSGRAVSMKRFIEDSGGSDLVRERAVQYSAGRIRPGGDA
ncbi:MAG: hypothetical protein HYU36_16470 [Planctomycetes bacterium]|nr:hypothetical protein [Planctomycetota bacterium]